MPNAEELRSCILDTINSDTPEVLYIHGAWGVGKTYQALEAIKESGKKYIYISLFGATSIKDVENEIYREATLEKSPIGLKSNKLKMITSLLNNINENINGLPVSVDIESISQHVFNEVNIEEVTICIDDLERRDTSLTDRSVMGLISKIKEKKECNVILIGNDEKIGSKREFHDYKEKIFDTLFKFSPPIEDIANIALHENKSDTIREAIKDYHINNIKICKKIIKLNNKLPDISIRLPDNLKERITSGIALFSKICFAPKETGITLENIKNYNAEKYDLETIKTEDKINKEKEDKIEKLLSFHHGGYLIHMDKLIIKCVESGYITNELKREISAAVEVENELKIRKDFKLDRIITLEAFGTFEENKKIGDKIHRTIKGKVEIFNTRILDRALMLLDSLECFEKTNDIIQEIKEKRGNKDLIDQISNSISREMIFSSEHKELKETIESIWENYRKTREPEKPVELLKTLHKASKVPPHPEKIVQIGNISQEDIYDYISGCRSIKDISNAVYGLNYAEENGLIDKRKIEAAKGKIKARSKLDELRVKQFFGS